MKILWQAYDATDYTGGPIVNTVRLLPELQKRGHTVKAVIEYNNNHPNADRLVSLGIDCYLFPKPRYADDHVRIYLEQIAEFKPDIFVSNISAHAALAGRWAIEWGIPVVHTHRSDDALNNGAAEFFFASLPEWRLSALVAVNRYLLDKIQALTPQPIRHKIIPSGVPISPYRAVQSGASKLKIAYAGRLIEKQKKVTEVIQGFIALAGRSQELEFTIIGSGEEKLVKKLKTMVEASGFKERIRFAGKLTGDDYKKKLADHQVIVLLSDYEGIPGSVMDGMSCGLVPVVSAIAGINELIIDRVNGMVVHDRAEGFIDAVMTLKNDNELRKRLSEEALQTVANKFSLGHACDEWENLFYELRRDVDGRDYATIKLPKKIALFQGHPLLLDYRRKPRFKEKLLRKLDRLKKAFRF